MGYEDGEDTGHPNYKTWATAKEKREKKEAKPRSSKERWLAAIACGVTTVSWDQWQQAEADEAYRKNPAAYFSIGPIPGLRKVDSFPDDPGSGCYNVARDERIATSDGKRITGKVRVVAGRDDFFGGEDSKDFRSKIYTDPTYQAIFGAFKKQMQATQDLHHCYLESVYVVGTEGPLENRVTLVRLGLGS